VTTGALPQAGWLVSEIGLGTATFGELTTPDDVDALVDLAVNEGVSAVDTGDI
jgi:aryl-alcohol dehydrogenase-like predicted oxidoreductase